MTIDYFCLIRKFRMMIKRKMIPRVITIILKCMDHLLAVSE